MKVAGYVQAPRGQSGHSKLGPAGQREQIERYVADQGWELVEVYEDRGGGERLELARLAGRLEDIDKVVMTRLDRLPRSVEDVLAFIRKLRAADVGLVCLEEGFDTAGDEGRVVVDVLQEVGRWERADAARAGWSADSLRKPGFSPATLIDVGVAAGTGSLYEAFPEAYLVLIEPLAEFEPQLSALVARRPGEYILTAVGASTGAARINVNLEVLTGSSVLPLVRGTDHQREERAVPITTLDALRAEHRWTPPFGLKIDTEGFEDRVIEGAGSLLEETQFVLAEVSMTDRFEGSYTFAEFVASMDARGFQLCDVLHLERHRRDRDVQYMDALFRRGG